MASSKPIIQVVLGMLLDAQQRILFNQRPEGTFMPGFWELPGGKVEADETALQALARELHEELGITFQTLELLGEFSHDYPDRSVHLHVWKIKDFHPKPHGAEGQLIRWFNRSELKDVDILPATVSVLRCWSDGVME